MLVNNLYKRRIVNINCNIIFAAVFSSIATAICIWLLTEYLFTFEYPKKIIVVATLLIDLVFDVIIYFVLHYYSNQFRGNMKAFYADATLIQFQRAMLSPILYIIAVSTQYYLLLRGVTPWITVFIAYGIAVFITRIIHTIYGLRTGLFLRRL